MPVYVIQLLCFVIAAGVVFWFARRTALEGNRYHAIYRIIGLESFVAVTTLNGPDFFREAFEAHQIVSWALMIGGLAYTIYALLYLIESGELRHDINISDHFLDEGPYQHVRHPMNAGVMFFAVSMLLKHFTPAALGLTVLCILGMFLASKAKEREWRERYRVKWEKYEKRTKAFIPGVY